MSTTALRPLLLANRTVHGFNSALQFHRRNLVSRGAISGGFNEAGLKKWAKQHWGLIEDDDHLFVDLHHADISKQCSSWLDQHPHPSSELARAFFGSNSFRYERILLSPFFYSPELPNTFQPHSQFLAWTVVSQTPHEIIFEWKFSSKAKGCTMVAFDPTLSRVYQGNGLPTIPASLLIQFHDMYSTFLLKGMVEHLEGGATRV